MTSWKEWRLPHCPGVNLERFVGTTGFWWFSAVIKSYSISFDNGTFGITPVNSDQNLLLWKTRWGLLQLKWYVFQKRVAGVQDANLVTQQQRDILRSAVLFVWRELIARIIVGLRPFSLSLILRPRYFLDGNFNHHPILIASNNQANEAVLTFQNIGLKDVNRSFTCSCVLNKPPAAWMLFFAKSWGALDISKWCKLCILGCQLNLLPIQVLLKSCQSSELVAPSGDAEGSSWRMDFEQCVFPFHCREIWVNLRSI